MARHRDPTEDVLATIASIIDKSDQTPFRRYQRKSPGDKNTNADKPASEAVAEPAADAAAPADSDTKTVSSVVDAAPAAPAEPISEPEVLPPPPPPPEPELPPEPHLAETYRRSGPGPLDSLRLTWTSRKAGNGLFLVEEQIGQRVETVLTKPMSGDDAVAYIDRQITEAQERFDRLRTAGHIAPPPPPSQGDVDDTLPDDEPV